MAELVTSIPQGVNPALLDSQLRVIATFNGLASTADPTSWRLLFTVTPVQADVTTAISICSAHNPAQLTPQQQTNAANDAAIANLQASIAGEINHFKASNFTAANVPNLAAAVTELVRLANDVAAMAQLLQRRDLS